MNTRARTWASALVVACGTLAAVAAGPVVVRPSAGGVALSLPGQAAFHTASGAVLSPRVVQVPGTPTLLITWSERQAGRPARAMYAISLDGRKVDTVQPADYVIAMQYAEFDPLVATPEVPASMTAAAGNELYIVQYITQPLPSMQAGVAAAGGSIQRYLPQWSEVVRMTPAARARVAALPYVRWVGEYHPAYKLSPAVFAAAAGGESDAPSRYSIETLVDGPAQQQAVSAMVAAMGGQVNVQTLDQSRMEATLTPAQLLAVARRNEVNYIDPWLGPGGADMDMIRKIGGAVPTLSDAGFTGQGVRGEVFDTENRNTHQGFQNPGPIKHSNAWTTPGGLHGTACYGIVFAKWAAQPNATGMCPDREQGIFYAYSEASSFGGSKSRLTLNTEATDPNGPWKSSFQTSSVGNNRVLAYTTISAETDDYLFKVDYLSCQSQSNAGDQMSRPEAWSKNLVSVGGIDHKNTLTKVDDTVSGASIGPAADKRTKPDLAHSYLDVFTTWGDSDTATTQFSGTSGATPIVAGHFGLLLQMWHAGVWDGFGGGSSVFADRPRAQTAKALMINTAYRYTWTGTPPAGEPLRATIKREIQGWGMPDVGNMYNLRDKTFIVNESDVLTPLASKQYNVHVELGEPNLNVTMCYKDPKGNPGSPNQHRINNLDLKVTSPAGAIYYGNNGLSSLSTASPSNVSTPGGSANTKDTVENVFLPNPEPGEWKVEVIGAEIVQDGDLSTPAIDAVYGLVVTGGTQLPPVQISLPSGLPEALTPGQDNVIDVTIEPGSQTPSPSSAKVFYRYGPGGFTEAALTYLGGNDYRATLSPPGCSGTPEFYFRAQGDQGGTSLLPSTAPTAFLSVPAGQVVTVASDNFQAATGWVVENTFVQAGAWTRTVPNAGGLAGDPPADFDGSGMCYVTGPAVQEDLDGGPTVLTSPTYDLAGMDSAKISYALWHYTNEATASDSLKVTISNDNGQTWHDVQTLKDDGGWTTKKFKVSDILPPTAQMKVRLTIADDPNNSVTEAALDAFKITRVQCLSTCYADCNADFALNLADFGCFQTKFALGDSYADCNNDGVLNLADFGCFQTKFALGCP
ncbi:MAG: S8 family serine peptidase [Phycisphaerales bacterium]|nr:S8 family serine peptidase [Phycisphaerales bacterium]